MNDYFLFIHTFANGSVMLGVETGFEKIPLNEWNWFELRLTYLDSVSGHPTLQAVLLFETKSEKLNQMSCSI